MDSCNFTIYDMIVRNASLYLEKCAIVYGEDRISFKTYQILCDQCANGLMNEGIKVGDRVAVLANNCDDFMTLCGAAAKIGAIVVPVNYKLSEGEVEYILKDTEPKYVFSSKEHKELALKACRTVGSIKQHYVFKAEKKESDCIPFGTLLLDGRIANPEAVSGGTAYLIIYTAAVGGKPRGSVLSHTNILAAGLQMAQIAKLNGDDCHIGLLPLFHIGGFSTTIAVMHQGGKNVILDRFDPLLVLKLTVEEQGTFFGTFPPMLAAILDAQDKSSIETPSLRGIGWLDSPDNIKRFFKKNPQATFYTVYGQAEAMPICGGDIKEKPGSIGLPAILTRVAIFDDKDQEVSAGVQGEICVHSASVFQGYWHLEKETAYVFRNRWHHTGDLGRIDQEGFMWYNGRKPEKELIKSGGENVYPAEVEQTILSHSGIEEVCVFGVPDAEWGEAVKAVCVLKKGKQVSAQELIDHVVARIARYKKPRYVLFVENLPKDTAGKIDRERVKKM